MSAENPLDKVSHEAASLSQIPLFKRLTPAELEQLAQSVDQVNFKAEETVFNEQDQGDALYVVDSGSVRIWVLDEDVKAGGILRGTRSARPGRALNQCDRHRRYRTAPVEQ